MGKRTWRRCRGPEAGEGSRLGRGCQGRGGADAIGQLEEGLGELATRDRPWRQVPRIARSNSALRGHMDVKAQVTGTTPYTANALKAIF